MGFLHVVLALIYVCGFASTDNDSPIYNIKIKKESVKLSEVQGNHFEVVSVTGQQFSCTVPNVTKQNEYPDLAPKNTSDDIQNVFASWNMSSCLNWFAGWWTYELCIGREILQYHKDKDVVLASTSLGSFAKDFDWGQAEKSDLQVRNRYHSQFYDQGSICDVTGKPRSTEVQFSCQYYAPTPTIIEVSEVATCSYVVRVVSADLCIIPALTPWQELKPSDIVCSPSLSDESYLKFVEVQKQEALERKQLEEERSFRNILPQLSVRRRLVQERVLSAHRTYRKRLEMGHLHAARKLRRQCVNFLKMVENNFDPINNTLFDLSFLQPESNVANSGELHSDSLIQLFKNILSFKISHKSESPNFGMEDAIAANKLEAHNQTLEIACLLLDRMRSSFENSLGAGQRPKTMSILNGFLNLLRSLVQLTSVRGLVEVRLAIEHHHPPRLYRPFSGNPEFYDFYQSSQLAVERAMLNILNSTILLSRNAVKIIYLQMYVSTLMSSDYSNKVPVKFSFDEISLPGEDPQDVDVAESTKTVNLFQEAINSPKLQSVLKLLPANERQAVILKAAIRPLDDDTMALIISFGDERTTNANHEENVENYNIKVNFD
eukprot:TsM_000304100 transcript=TsM_000304100 gene=TsM_000304100